MSGQIQTITMPKWGMEMTEGLVGDWYVAVGAEVTEGDDLVDVETSKIVNTVTATASGVLQRIIANPGENLPVGAVLGVLAPAGTAETDIEAFVSQFAGAAPAAEPAPAPAPAPEVPASAAAPVLQAVPEPVPAPAPAPAAKGNLSALADGPDDSAVAASPVARRLAAHFGVNLNNIPASGPHGRVSKADLEAAVAAAGGTLLTPSPASGNTAAQDDSAVAATPVARRLAAELGINLNDCRSSGDRGRVCKADVEARAALNGRATLPVTAVTEAAPAPAFEERPLSGMRKTIAARLQQSKQTAPHFRVQVDAQLDALLALRTALNAAHSEAKISVNDFIIKACASALVRVPEVNVQFDGEQVRYFADADIAVAVALDDGLITPIVRGANKKGLVAVSNEVRDLATRAKLGRLQAEEFQGGTFSVSNLGMFGVKQFDAIINPPQCAILAVGAGEPRPVWRDGSWQAATVVSLSLSSDHRIIDGAVAARFMAALKGFLEEPGTMLG
ncbi:2-oxo acid dehydrogenase subunit E2 [Haliea sp. E17]|uniref:2-oxo acid dehydrogenase subunit E2 n=1 Tax=Haliea sp. E17 TaxID=3401576 RepID=UPI003AAF292F